MTNPAYEATNSDVEKLITRKGSAVTGNYYLAECGSCGEMFTSERMTGGEAIADTGDYGDCYCPHCDTDDSEIIDCGAVNSAVVEAWNFQQKHIDALIAALEQAQRQNGQLKAERDALRESGLNGQADTRAAADIYFQLIEECDIPPGGSLVQHVDGMRDRIAEMKRKCVELKTSHDDLRESMAAIHNTIRGNGAYVSLSVLLTATENAWSKSASAAAITVECKDVITCWSCKKSMTLLERSSADGFCPHCDAEIDMQDDRASGGTVEGGE